MSAQVCVCTCVCEGIVNKSDTTTLANSRSHSQRKAAKSNQVTRQSSEQRQKSIEKCKIENTRERGRRRRVKNIAKLHTAGAALRTYAAC
jgi:hypothetical protein